MADFALVTADKVDVVESIIQHTAPTAEAITAGNMVRFDTTTGKFTKSNGTTAPEARVYGMAVKTVAAGLPVTAIRKGVVDGLAITGSAFDAPVYLSDTDGALADAAGTVSVVVGRIIGGHATTTGTVADKLLFIDL